MFSGLVQPVEPPPSPVTVSAQIEFPEGSVRVHSTLIEMMDLLNEVAPSVRLMYGTFGVRTASIGSGGMPPLLMSRTLVNVCRARTGAFSAIDLPMGIMKVSPNIEWSSH